MNNNRQIIISAAGSRKATKWPQQKLMWSEFVEKLKTPVRSTETYEQYLALSKTKKDDLKDVGGFVGGSLGDNLGRKADNVTGRDILTLDMDNIQPGQTQDVLRRVDGLGCGYVVYSTRKHSEATPRLRVILPLDRTATSDEYEPLARKIASIIGLDLCDPTTFQAHRLMYWPSCCVDGQYVYQYGDKPFLSADGVLSMYGDWHNIAEWPQVPGAQQAQIKLAAKQGDPTTKTGIVGAFCKIYDVFKAIKTFIPDAYDTCDMDDRLTYTGGSTTGGAIIYDNGNFIYSHHATDPAGGKLCNAFDLVRLHLFGDQDDDVKPDTPTNKLPSYVEMCKFAVADSYVATLMIQERYDKATQDFDTPIDEDENWKGKLITSPTTGAIAKTINNIIIILEHDPHLKNKLAFDEFSNRGLVLDALPWNNKAERRLWADVDDSGIRNYLELTYGITGKEKILDAVALVANKNTINDVKQYLTSLEWDNVKRLDTLLVDYLGANDTPYTRAVIRKSLCAAVARIMMPGTKYDYMPILIGPQGLGKSTFLRLLGRKWYSDSLQTFEGKEASEMIQGTWINEIGELNSMNRSETNAVKQFLSKTDDIYREPYGRRTKNYPRRSIFFGTTNESEFLKDRTGNRRFWPVDTGINPTTKNIFEELENEVDQIWAEAFIYWQLGEVLYLRGAAEEEAKIIQEEHRESSAREGLIKEFLDRPIPLDWYKRTLEQRRMYWNAEFARDQVETMIRDRVCALEVWCECLGGDIKYLKRQDAMEINGIIASFQSWERIKQAAKFGCYGAQKGFEKR